MAAETEAPSRLRYESREALEQGLERNLKQLYSRGIYVEDSYEASDGTLVIHLGNVVPKDVSDSRSEDHVLKLISFDTVYNLTAEPTNAGYIVELPSREAVYSGYRDRRDEIRNRLDISIAKETYKRLVTLPPIQNQLNPVLQILRWTREHSPEITIKDVTEIQNSKNTLDYVEVLDELDFIRVGEDERLYPEAKLNTYDVRDISASEFHELVLGDVVQEAYHTMKDELRLTMLGHYPKFTTAYYFSAIQREDPHLWLDVGAIRENLVDLYDEDIHEFVVQSKLDDLTEVDVLRHEDSFYSANRAIYHNVIERVPV